jgi:hypothetical protein
MRIGRRISTHYCARAAAMSAGCYARPVRLFVTLALVAGCDSLWGITRISPATDGAPPVDSTPIDATCQPQIIHDDFTGTKLCGTWGTPSGLDATEGGGMLVIAPIANTGGSQGGCFTTAPTAFGRDGIFIKVVSVLDQAGTGNGGSYTFFRISSPTPVDGVTLQLSVAGNQIQAATGTTSVGTTAYDTSRAAWWRIRPDDDLPGVAGDFSVDGLTWQTIGRTAGRVPTSVTLEFTAGTYGAGLPDPGQMVIEDFNICPPA